MMVAQRSSALPYESLPTEDGEVPTSFTYRNADSPTPIVTHHPIPIRPHHPDRSKWITCTLVTVLIILASILGMIIGFAAQRAHYPDIYKLAEGVAPIAGGSGGGAHGGSSLEGKGEHESNISSSEESNSWESSEESSATTYRPGVGSTEKYGLSGGVVSSTKFGWETSSKTNGQENFSTESGKFGSTASTWTATPVVALSTTQVTTLPTTTSTTTTTTTTTAATTTASTTASTTAATTATSTAASTASPVTMVTTSATLSTTPPSGVGDEKETSPATGHTDDGAGAASASVVVTDGYNSNMGVVDYMVVMQKKLPVGLVLTILLFVIVVTVGSLAAIVYVVKRKTTKTRRRAHVRRAINELRAQDKSNLLQSDEEEG